MSWNNSTETIPNQENFFLYAAFILRLIASLAVFMNICVLFLLIKLKRTFRNYGYWFQILVLASADLLTGTASLPLTFFDHYVFRTNTIACSAILFAYSCTQTNTLLGIMCICVNRFRNIQNIDKLRESKPSFKPEIAVISAALFSMIYTLLPFLFLKLNTTVLPVCSAPALFLGGIRTYKLLLLIGLIIPLVVINVLYAICLVKLRRANARIQPADQHIKVDFFTRHVKTDDRLQGTSTSKEMIKYLKVGAADTFNKTSSRNIAETLDKKSSKPTPSIEECSTSATADTASSTGNTQSLASSNIRASTREAQSKAVKLLGIILFSTNIATIVPVFLLFRDTIVSSEEQMAGSSAFGLALLCLNSLVDAFVYGLYATEIRTYIHTKLTNIKRLCCTRQ